MNKNMVVHFISSKEVLKQNIILGVTNVAQKFSQGNLSSMVANISQPLLQHQNLSSITFTKTMCVFAGADTVHQAEAVSYRILLSCSRLSL